MHVNDNDDVSMYNLPGYNMIYQGKVCCGHGGLIIFLNDKYTHTVRNLTYDIIDKQIPDARETFLPVKTVRFNKNKHTHKSWMTADILRAIKYRDNLYKAYLSKPINSAEKAFYKTNLGTCNNILKKDIREAKKIYYCTEINKYRGPGGRVG